MYAWVEVHSMDRDVMLLDLGCSLQPRRFANDEDRQEAMNDGLLESWSWADFASACHDQAAILKRLKPWVKNDEREHAMIDDHAR